MPLLVLVLNTLRISIIHSSKPYMSSLRGVIFLYPNAIYAFHAEQIFIEESVPAAQMIQRNSSPP